MDELEQHLRATFDSLHQAQGKDEAIYRRLVNLVRPAFFKLPDDYFVGKTVLDAGCGSNANATYALLHYGAQHVTALDLGEEWKGLAREKLSSFAAERFELVSGNILQLPFPDQHFDFVHCDGVLHHIPKTHPAFLELARVTRGYLYVGLHGTGNGIIYQWLELLRQRYQTDETFRTVIDQLDQAQLEAGVQWILETRAQEEGLEEGEAAFFQHLFNYDLILTLKDRLQAEYYNFHYTEAQVRGWFEAAGFTDIQRITKYPLGMKNFRRYFAPMFYHYDHPLARAFFGEGYLQIIGRKAV